MHPLPAAPRRALVVTSSPDALDDLLRLAATAGAEVEVAPDAGQARRSWASAPLVVVGRDEAERCARLRLPRREHVVLLGEDLDDAGIWQLAVEVGAEHVVFLPDAEQWLIDRFSDAAEARGPEAPLVAVVGGRGGAGATTLAAALAVTAARAGQRSLLVDGDPLGGGIDLVFGAEGEPGLRWPELSGTRGRLAAASLAQALPRMSDVAVLSWGREGQPPLPVDALRAVLAAARRASDVVVVDLPRALDEGARAVLAGATTTLLVVPAEVRAAAAAARVVAALDPLCRDLRLVVRGPAPSGLGGTQVAAALGLPLLGELRAEPGLELGLERGQPPARKGRGPLAALCETLLGELVASCGRAA